MAEGEKKTTEIIPVRAKRKLCPTLSNGAGRFLKTYCTCDPTGKTLKWWRGEFYFWQDGKYVRVNEEQLKAEIVQYLRANVTTAKTNTVNEIVLNLRGLVLLDEKTPANSWLDGKRNSRAIVARNGIVCLEEYDQNGRPVLQPHTPDYFAFSKLPYDYDPKATCPGWQVFLADIMDNDAERVRLLQQWAGYLLTPTLKEQKFLICVGEGKNGKGVFFNVILAMLGSENCSALPLRSFADRFALYSTYGKLVNASSEGIGEIKPHAEAVLKEYTSGDLMTFERKYRDQFHAVPTAKLMFATNELPCFRDKTEGIWRRLLLVPFEKTYAEDQQDKNLTEKLKEELPGIFNWAYDGMVDLEKNGFLVPDKSGQATEQYRRDVNPAKLFLQENYRMDPESEGVACGSVYSLYSKWCDERGYQPLNEANLGKEVRRVFPRVEKRRVRKDYGRPNVYANLSLLKDAEIVDDESCYAYARRGNGGHSGHSR